MYTDTREELYIKSKEDIRVSVGGSRYHVELIKVCIVGAK